MRTTDGRKSNLRSTGSFPPMDSGNVRRFSLQGCDPAGSDTVFFLDSEHEWTTKAIISGAQAGDAPVIVRLVPCGSAKARLVTRGKPIGHRFAERSCWIIDADGTNSLAPCGSRTRHAKALAKSEFPSPIGRNATSFRPCFRFRSWKQAKRLELSRGGRSGRGRFADKVLASLTSTRPTPARCCPGSPTPAACRPG
jgi:hypothetical protein